MRYEQKAELQDSNKARMYEEKKKELKEIKESINFIESSYPNLHIDLHRDQFKKGDADMLQYLYKKFIALSFVIFPLC